MKNKVSRVVQTPQGHQMAMKSFENTRHGHLSRVTDVHLKVYTLLSSHELSPSGAWCPWTSQSVSSLNTEKYSLFQTEGIFAILDIIGFCCLTDSDSLLLSWVQVTVDLILVFSLCLCKFPSNKLHQNSHRWERVWECLYMDPCDRLAPHTECICILLPELLGQ